VCQPGNRPVGLLVFLGCEDHGFECRHPSGSCTRPDGLGETVDRLAKRRGRFREPKLGAPRSTGAGIVKQSQRTLWSVGQRF
jgi:hypothetical protein